MKRTQYIIKESNVEERKKFYNYIISKYNFEVWNNEDVYYYSKFPFVVDFKEKKFWVCESITCCAAAQQGGVIISIGEFKKTINK